MTKYFRANPQVFVLFLVCVVLGLGTFIAVLIALVQIGHDDPQRRALGRDRDRRRAGRVRKLTQAARQSSGEVYA